MKIWHVTRREDVQPVRDDEMVELVVVARTRQGARRIAAAVAQDEGREVWTTAAKSTVSLVGEAKPNSMEGYVMYHSTGF